MNNCKKNLPKKENCEQCRHIYCVGPTGPRGPRGLPGMTGPTGPSGSRNSRSAYFVTFNDGTSQDGIPVNTNSPLPIDRKELDITNLVTLDTTNQTLKFNEIGYYRISIIASAYSKKTDTKFEPATDFVTIGLRQLNTDNIYIGASRWTPEEIAREIRADGIISVADTNITYEIVNLGKKTIYLFTPDLSNISSNSYFTNSLLTIIVEYLGR